MAIEEEEVPGVPEWVVTFGDMMSLLLTFFIMLVSMSEMKQEEKFQAMLESMRRQFGHDTSTISLLPGPNSNANSSLPYMAPAESRANRQKLLKGGNIVQAVTGDQSRVQDVRRGKNSTSGGVIYFDEDTADLTEEARRALATIATVLAGKPQKIEIRGHTSRRPIDPHTGLRDHWDLAFQRCYNTMQFLISQGIDPERIRLGSAAAFEPVELGLEVQERKRNARVEVLLWDERVTDDH